ncbi:hypothetical protein FY557_17955 [Chryseobacterium sp. SN22]|uniref:hypothetical protein n=1 Tax=Chryseobacterium sp. SN22 TaxID=2606431 RepID=UPI0011EEC587|nr:hypothetical protein [Chryseobacterium sp. SN22]KAA0126317.1 hypothetical protein FY557_17955 [Chryseobacterium sp. SN22]
MAERSRSPIFQYRLLKGPAQSKDANFTRCLPGNGTAAALALIEAATPQRGRIAAVRGVIADSRIKLLKNQSIPG